MLAAQANTVLRSGLPGGKPETNSYGWLQRGFLQEKEQGLMRALFCIRLCELAGEGTSEERMSFLMGAFISNTYSGIRSWLARPLVLTGNEVIGNAWRDLLIKDSIDAEVCSVETVENAFITGLLRIHGDTA